MLLAAAGALRARPPRLVRVLQQTVHTTGQAAVRLSVFMLAGLVFISVEAGFDFVLGAFAGGLVVGLALSTPERLRVRMRLEGVGFGFLDPDLLRGHGDELRPRQPADTPTGLGLAALFLGLFVVVRGTPSLLWLRDLGPRRTLSLALFGATGLPLIVAIVGIGIERGAIGRDVGTSLIGAGMISVLVLPLIATSLARRESSRLDDARVDVARLGWRPEVAKMADDEQAARPRVLVLGGGFAGVGAAQALKNADVDVVLVDKHDYHTFQPLLYQVATALLEPAEVGHPLRDLFDDQKNATRPQSTRDRDRPRQAARSSSRR